MNPAVLDPPGSTRNGQALARRRPTTTVTVKYRGLLRTATGLSEEELAITDTRGAAPEAQAAHPATAPHITITVAQLLERLAQRHGAEFRYYTRGADGTLLPHAMIVVDGMSVRRGQDVELPIAAGAVTEILVVPAMCGG